MDKRVYLLTIVSFVVGMVELIIGGILDLIAVDLGVSLGQAGLLITVFSLVFAIAAPILLYITKNIERKKLTLIAMFIFLIGNIVAVFSPTYSFLILARIISAASGSLLIILCITLASNIVKPEYRGRAIGIVVMGVSGSLVLGVPIGVMLGNSFGWRAPFIFITLLTVISMAGVYFFMGRIAPRPTVSLGKQLATLKNNKILLAQCTTFFLLAGHITLYGYFTPFLQTSMGLSPLWITVVYLIYGIAAVIGGGIGGILADRYGSEHSILTVIIMFGIAFFIIPYTTFSFPLFIIVMIVWGVMSWAITPPIQSYLIETSPQTADVQQSLNNSALHFGIAFGSLVGGIVIERTSVTHNATFGGLFVIIALATAIFSMRSKNAKEISIDR